MVVLIVVFHPSIILDLAASDTSCTPLAGTASVDFDFPERLSASSEFMLHLCNILILLYQPYFFDYFNSCDNNLLPKGGFISTS